MRSITIDFAAVAKLAGHVPAGDGKLNLPPTQATADALGAAAMALVPWAPGDEPYDATLTGAGPVWGHLCIAHALHGRVARLTYAAPNATIQVYSHGV